MVEFPFHSGGYFTWLEHVLEAPGDVLEREVGFARGSLAGGWKLLTPHAPLAPWNIVLKGSTRWSDGKLKDGRDIDCVIAGRSDAAESRLKVARFFDRGLDRRPVKILPNTRPDAYPAAEGAAVPQFKLRESVAWVLVLDVHPGGVARRREVAAALGL
jgi:hypothetical protein